MKARPRCGAGGAPAGSSQRSQPNPFCSNPTRTAPRVLTEMTAFAPMAGQPGWSARAESTTKAAKDLFQSTTYAAYGNYCRSRSGAADFRFFAPASSYRQPGIPARPAPPPRGQPEQCAGDDTPRVPHRGQPEQCAGDEEAINRPSIRLNARGGTSRTSRG